ncbi:MAG TPA: DEAD/DEAH box helicase [Kofleriaceae bacterium]|nr:DEAD/DEAH box helicase [Kofleriaceae bacterium]
MIDELGPSTDEVMTDIEPDASASGELQESLPPSGFAAMGLSPEIQQALADMGYLEPMEVQKAVFEHVMGGRDIMVQSRTGSGKTAAFGIPIVQNISPESSGVQVLILAPTRELAIQVAEELKRITRHTTSLAVVPIYGGAPMKPQLDALHAGAQIVAGTPGRVLDHIRRRTLRTDAIRYLVLDECDEMLSMGFQEEIEKIIQTLPPREERQTMLFSATIPEAIERIGRRYMREPDKISLSNDGIGVREISHHYYMVSGLARTRDLLKVLKAEKPESAIIFCNTRDDTATVARYLQRAGYDAEAISSDLTQKDRERVMGLTRAKKLKFMVATDIAARGIDISDLSHVINYQFPESPEVYVHRTGRTGRAGKKGVALSLVGPREIGAFYYLKLIYKIRPEERDLPSAEEIQTMQEGEQYEQVVKLVQERPSAQYLSLARRLWQSVEGERVVGALLERLLGSGVPAVAPQVPQVRPVLAAVPAAAESEAGDAAPVARASAREAREAREWGEAPSGGAGGERGAREERPQRSDRDRDRGGRGGRGGRDRDRGGRGPERGARAERGGRGERSERGEDRPVVRQVWTGRGETIVPGGAVPPPDRDATAPGAESELEGVPAVAVNAEGAEVRAADPVAAAAEAGGEVAGKRRRRRRRVGETDSASAGGERGERGGRGRGGREGGGREGGGREGREKKARPPLLGSTGPANDLKARDGQEFWEAWADEKVARSSPGVDSGLPMVTDPLPPANGDAPAEAPADRGGNGGDEAGADDGGGARLYVNIGKREDATADDIRALLSQDLGEDAARLGAIALRNTHAYVRCPEDLVDRVIESTRGKSFKERELLVERARR